MANVDCDPQIQTISRSLLVYFEASPISTSFFLFLFFVASLNILKSILIHWEKKNGYSDLKCRYLSIERDEQVCKLQSRKQEFKDRKNSCNGCAGRTFSVTNEDVADRLAASATWKRIAILLADCSRSILPYVSFLYTLFIAIFEKAN